MSIALKQTVVRLIVGKVFEVFLLVTDFYDLTRIKVAQTVVQVAVK